MKAELRPKPHSHIPGAIVVEVWHGGKMIGTVYGADGPGIRVMSKYGLNARLQPGAVSIAEVFVPVAPDVSAGA